MINLSELCRFLTKAKKATYASGDSTKKIKESDFSTTLLFEEGDWKYHDNYFGWEPFGGREVVHFQGKPMYVMTYYGLIKKSVKDFEEVYRVLREALNLLPEKYPYRWPELYEKGIYAYKNIFEGEINNFYGEEVILRQEEIIYRTKYIGGIIDQK